MTSNIRLCDSCNNKLHLKNQQMADFDVGPDAPLETYQQYRRTLELIHHVPCYACNIRWKYNISLKTWNIFKCVLIGLLVIACAHLWSTWCDDNIEESDSNKITCECDGTIYPIQMNSNLCSDASFTTNYYIGDTSYDEGVFNCEIACHNILCAYSGTNLKFNFSELEGINQEAYGDSDSYLSFRNLLPVPSNVGLIGSDLNCDDTRNDTRFNISQGAINAESSTRSDNMYNIQNKYFIADYHYKELKNKFGNIFENKENLANQMKNCWENKDTPIKVKGLLSFCISQPFVYVVLSRNNKVCFINIIQFQRYAYHHNCYIIETQRQDEWKISHAFKTGLKKFHMQMINKFPCPYDFY